MASWPPAKTPPRVRPVLGREGPRPTLPSSARRPCKPSSIGHDVCDGSWNARRAALFLARLAPPPGGRVTMSRVEESITAPWRETLPSSVRAMMRRELADEPRTARRLERPNERVR